MFLVLLGLVILVVATNSAPTPAATALLSPQPLAYQYFYLAQPQQPFQTLVKYQQPLIQPITSMASRLESQKDQMYLLYPSAPQYPILLRQEGASGTDWWSNVQNFFQNIGGNFGESEAPAESPQMPAEETSPAAKEHFTREKDSEPIPQQSASPQLPASTTNLNANKRFFVLSGQPQFFGNFDALQTASNPILSLQPLQQAFRARSNEGSIRAEPELPEAAKTVQQDVVQLSQVPPVVPLEPGSPLQLRSTFDEPLQPLVIEQPQVPVVNNEPVPAVAARQLARFLAEAGAQDGLPNSENIAAPQLDDEEKKKENNDFLKRTDDEESAPPAKNEFLKRSDSEPESSPAKHSAESAEDEQSIAQAKPSGIALSGKGGIASSSPIATALVGDGGLALASPSATAVSGDFSNDEEDDERKNGKKE